MVSSYQVNFGEGGAAGKALGVVFDVWYWIPGRDGARVEGSVDCAGPPNVVLLCHEKEGGRPRTFGAYGGAVPEHGVEHGLGVGHTVWCQAAWSVGYGWTGFCANVVCCVVPDVAVVPCWLGKTRELFQEAVWCCASSDDFKLGTDDGAVRPGVDSDVTPSSRRLFLQSTRSP